MSLEHRLHARCGCGLSSSALAEDRGAERSTGGMASARPFAFATSPRNFERDRPFAVLDLALDLTLHVETKSLSGSATLTLRRVDPDAETLSLDAIGFQVTSVHVGGAPVAYIYDGRAIDVPIGKSMQEVVVKVTYAATPPRGIYFLAPDEHVRDRPQQVWTQCQEEDARYFIPCHDKPHVKMTTSIDVRVPNGWSVLSNGALVSKETPAEGLWRFHWKMSEPHPSYLLTLVAGRFVELTAEAKGQTGNVPLTYLVPEGKAEDGARTFGRTPEMVNYFGEMTGVLYPWNKYAQVVVSDFIFGGMENTTATTLYEHSIVDERASQDVSSDDLIAHELAHQWFGDYVTCRDWSEAWLNEGFATYLEHVWREKHLGRDEYDYAVKGDLDSYLGEAAGRYRRPIVCQDYDAPLDLFDRHLYEKGGLVLHTLRVELGTTLFWRGVNVYLTRHARGIVETRDLQRALEEVSGRSLGQHFEQGVMRAGHPECDVTVSWEKKVLTVACKQHQAATDGVPAHFEFPLVMDVFEGDGKAARRERLKVTQKSESFAIPCPTRPSFVVVDPLMRILGDVQLKVPNDMLRAALEKAPTARGRWLAAVALAKADDPVTVAALAARVADHEEAWMVRAEAAEALGRIRSEAAQAVLAGQVTTAHPKVRRAIVAALGRFKNASAYATLTPRALSDASYLVEAEAARSLGRTRQPAAFDTLLEVASHVSWADVVAAGAVDGLAALRDERATPHLLTLTKYGRPMRVRRAAIMALPKVGEGRAVREALEELLTDNDPHLRIDVARALGEIGDVKSRGPLREQLEGDLDARVRRRLREILRDLGHDTKKATDALREEIEKLQAEHATIKARLSQLEARGTEGEGGTEPKVATARAPERTGGKKVDKTVKASRSKKPAPSEARGARGTGVSAAAKRVSRDRPRGK